MSHVLVQLVTKLFGVTPREQFRLSLYTVSQKNIPTFLAITRESIDGFL